MSPSSSTYSSQQHASSQPHAESTLMSFALKCFDMRGDPASGPDAQSMSASTVQVSPEKVIAAAAAYCLLWTCHMQHSDIWLRV